VCTGYRSGGAYAELCGIWAAVTYPSANVRTIAFGAPEVRQMQTRRQSSDGLGPTVRVRVSDLLVAVRRAGFKHQHHCRHASNTPAAHLCVPHLMS